MRSREGDVAKERAWFLDEIDGSFGDLGHNFVHYEARCDGATAIVGASLDFAVVGDFVGRVSNGPLAIDVNVGWHVERGRDAEVLVEAMIERAEREVFGVVYGVSCTEAEVPFAEAAGAVAVLLEEVGDGGTAVFDQVGGVAVEYSALKAAAPGVTAR